MRQVGNFLLGAMAVFQGGSAVSYRGNKNPGDRKAVESSLQRISEGEQGELARLSSECVNAQPGFVVEFVETLPLKGGLAMAIDTKAGYHAIKIPKKLPRGPATMDHVCAHELTHSTLGIVNANSAHYDKKVHINAPYDNPSEREVYKEVLEDFNDGLRGLKDKLIAFVKDRVDYKDLSTETKALLDRFSSPFSLKADFEGAGLKVGDSTNIKCRALPDELFGCKILETPVNIITMIRLDSPIVHALIKIEKYEEKLLEVTRDVEDAEQPAYMVQFFGGAIGDISRKMEDYMENRLSRCTPSSLVAGDKKAAKVEGIGAVKVEGISIKEL